MTLVAFLIISASVFLHAGWNFISKKNNPSLAFFTVMAFAGGAPWIYFAITSGIDITALPSKFWYLFAASIFFETVYMFGLAYGYKLGDMSMVYPLGRAFPVLFVADVTLIFGLGKTPSVCAISGMVIVAAGCIILPMTRFRDFSLRTYCSKVMLFIRVISCGTTGYTVVDSLSMKLLKGMPAQSDIHRSLFFVTLMQFALTLSLLLITLCKKQWREELKFCTFKSYQGYLAGFFSAVAYILVLLAMNHVDNVSYVQVFRQMSLPIGVFAGVFILKEPCTLTKIIGLIMIVTGLIMNAF